MRVSMDRYGNVMSLGEGRYEKPVKSNMSSTALTNPHAVAEEIRERNRQQVSAQAREKQLQKEKKAREAAEVKAVAKAAKEEENFQREVEKYENAGEHPLMYIAALQSMSGETRDMCLPLSGYGLSTDGVPAYDRAMGWGLSDVTSAIQSAASKTTSAISTVTGTVQATKTLVTNVIPRPAPPPPPATVVQAMTPALVAPVMAAAEQAKGFIDQLKETKIVGPINALHALAGGGALLSILLAMKIMRGRAKV